MADSEDAPSVTRSLARNARGDARSSFKSSVAGGVSRTADDSARSMTDSPYTAAAVAALRLAPAVYTRTSQAGPSTSRVVAALCLCDGWATFHDAAAAPGRHWAHEASGTCVPALGPMLFHAAASSTVTTIVAAIRNPPTTATPKAEGPAPETVRGFCRGMQTIRWASLLAGDEVLVVHTESDAPDGLIADNLCGVVVTRGTGAELRRFRIKCLRSANFVELGAEFVNCRDGTFAARPKGDRRDEIYLFSAADGRLLKVFDAHIASGSWTCVGPPGSSGAGLVAASTWGNMQFFPLAGSASVGATVEGFLGDRSNKFAFLVPLPHSSPQLLLPEGVATAVRGPRGEAKRPGTAHQVLLVAPPTGFSDFDTRLLVASVHPDPTLLASFRFPARLSAAGVSHMFRFGTAVPLGASGGAAVALCSEASGGGIDILTLVPGRPVGRLVPSAVVPPGTEHGDVVAIDWDAASSDFLVVRERAVVVVRGFANARRKAA